MLIESTGVIGHRIKKVKEDLHVSLFYLRLLVIRICMILSCVQFFPFFYLFFFIIHSSDYWINSYAGRSSQFPSKAC